MDFRAEHTDVSIFGAHCDVTIYFMFQCSFTYNYEHLCKSRITWKMGLNPFLKSPVFGLAND